MRPGLGQRFFRGGRHAADLGAAPQDPGIAKSDGVEHDAQVPAGVVGGIGLAADLGVCLIPASDRKYRV
ncbi:hypothetical protein [Streptomyces triculaminicus]|uniref:hypothetical protein n=1 Tax=Streptomyces triculaminicus TaxID=2816232 RepID=UPI0037D1D417